MSNMNFNCDVCGREVLGCTFVNGMKFCAKCYQETFGETDKDRKEVQVLKNLICKTRNILQQILIDKNRPIKNTSKKDCYKALSELQDLYKSNMITSNEWFLDKIQIE